MKTQSFFNQHSRTAFLHGAAITSAILVALLLTSCSNPEGDFKKAEQANTEQAYAAFIQKHPDSPLVAQAKAKIEDFAYEQAQTANSINAWEAFIQMCPQSARVEEAKMMLESLVFKIAQATNRIATWEAFLQRFPQSTNATFARESLAQLVYEQALTSNTVAAFDGVMARFTGTAAAKEAAKQAETLDYQIVASANDTNSCDQFLKKYPESQYIPAIKRLNYFLTHIVITNMAPIDTEIECIGVFTFAQDKFEGSATVFRGGSFISRSSWVEGEGTQVEMIRGSDGRVHTKVTFKPGCKITPVSSAWLPGLIHEIIGTATDLGETGFVFQSSDTDPLRFKLVRDIGYVYQNGKGTVKFPDGKVIELK